MTPAVFLDRDGTMIHDPGYLSRREDLRWFPWTIDAVRLLGRAGYRVFVVTNQGGVGLGLYPESFVQALHADMDETIRAAGGAVAGWYHCPHHPDAVIPALRIDCECRKPRPGMVRQAAHDHGPLDLARSFVVGDKFGDVGLAAAIGARGVIVRSGHGEAEVARHRDALPAGTHVAATLADATAWILRETPFEDEP